MAIALRHTDERVGYTLSDEPTFRQLGSTLDLAALYTDDETLLNTYAVIYPRDSETAHRFADWLVTGNGRGRLEQFAVTGVRLFHAWPEGCDGDRPAAPLCNH